MASPQYLSQLVPIRLKDGVVEKNDLKHKTSKGSLTLYGFYAENHPIVVAIQETSYFVALLKPWYRRMFQFRNFYSSPEDWEKARKEKASIREQLEIVTTRSNREERLTELFSREVSLDELKKRMILFNETRDFDAYINAFKEYYGP